jgi:large subunit ribosomal protein L18
MKKTHYNLKLKKRRKGITDYKKRLKLLLSGKPRLVVRKSLKNINVQIVGYVDKGDKVLAVAHSSQLKKLGWNAGTGNLPSAYLTGLLVGQKAKKQGIKDAVLDVGLNVPTKGGRLYAALRGVIDAGINVPHSKDVLPSDDRIKGAHIKNLAGFDDVKKKISEA